ncbi:MAG TPA: hypothetical protein VG347_24430 [Verrucomicrobiae bacterium]|nr:hypothetical protein [Verrucomicrobiae bacterium]
MEHINDEWRMTNGLGGLGGRRVDDPNLSCRSHAATGLRHSRRPLSRAHDDIRRISVNFGEFRSGEFQFNSLSNNDIRLFSGEFDDKIKIKGGGTCYAISSGESGAPANCGDEPSLLRCGQRESGESK